MEAKICIVRPPALPAYQDTDIKEDPMLTSFLGYLESINFPLEKISIFDFQLDRSLRYEDLLHQQFEYYIIATRDLGESYRYSLRMANCLVEDTNALIFLYGQVAPLRYIGKIHERIKIINQHEQELAENMGINNKGAHFSKDLRYKSYFSYLNLADWQLLRKKGAIETTRGCPYQCNFCFISVGQSYEKRWQTRPNKLIIDDIKEYIAQGIYDFVFLDSEFLGANPAYHKEKENLLLEIIETLPPINFMILCRADTLYSFNQYELLKRSGLTKVLVGVESLYQPDLDALNKNSSVEIMKKSIVKLIEQKIQCCLTFLTFHRNTTLQGLRENLLNIKELYSHKNARYLGMPNFSFNMEVLRGEGESVKLSQLSDLTYIKPLLQSRSQAKNTLSACFPVELEPLIEIYRLLQYEWVVKKCELIKAKILATSEEKKLIDKWFDGLGLFCVQIMEGYLDKYEKQDLTFNTLFEQKENLYKMYQEYNTVLPLNLRQPATYDHAKRIDYISNLKIENHGWDEILPISTKEFELYP